MDQSHESEALPSAASPETSAPSAPEAEAHAAPPASPPAADKPKAPPAPLASHKTVEEWARVKGTEAVWFDAAKVANHWGIGRELDEKAYVAAIDAAQNEESR